MSRPRSRRPHLRKSAGLVGGIAAVVALGRKLVSRKREVRDGPGQGSAEEMKNKLDESRERLKTQIAPPDDSGS